MTSPLIQRVRESAYVALTRYRPHSYSEKVEFVRAEISTDFPEDSAAVWSKLLGAIEIETIPGDHLEIMTTQFEHLASLLSRYVRQAQVDR